MASRVTAGDLSLPMDRLMEWLGRNGVPLEGPVQVELISGGRSNLTFGLTDSAGNTVVLRRPPMDGVLETAHDMGREWRFISALWRTDVPVAQPLAFGKAGEVLDCQFYVMSYVEGVVPHDARSAEALSLDARREAAGDLIDTMAALHALDPDTIGLATVAKRGDYIGRQIRRWYRQWESSTCTDITAIRSAFERLQALTPGQERTSIVHGDFRLGNMICGEDGRIRAVLDWELATLGDPLADLGWLLSYWVEAGELSDQPSGEASPSVLPGFPSRSWLLSRYEQRSGMDVSAINFYIAFSHWRSACISSGVLTRYEAGVMGDDGFDTRNMRQTVASRAESALALLDGL